METAAVEQQPRYVETRMMIGGQIVAVGDWFSPWIDEGTAINIIRARYSQQTVDIRKVPQHQDEQLEN